ncbi:MAG: sensor histidine kinase [Actinomycetota bacterium]
MLRHPASDADECRRLAELLNLDAVGLVRADERRRVAWWASPGADVVPLERILDGTATGWIALPRGRDLVFAHLPEGSSARSVSALSAMLASLATETDAAGELDAATPEHPIDRERMRLAYAIHDGLTQVVTASVLELEWHARRADVAPEEAVDALNAAAGELRVALEEIRSVLAGLSPNGGGSPEPLEELIQGVIQRWQLPANWSVDGDLKAVPAPVLDVASSVIRESVANAAKHGGSAEVAVKVRVTRNDLEVRVEDEGRGFRPTGTLQDTSHLGLEMMRRRVNELHGSLDIESSPGMGTRVVARLPVSEQGVKP